MLRKVPDPDFATNRTGVFGSQPNGPLLLSGATMTFSELILNLVPVLIAAAVAYFVWKSNRRQRTAVLIGWLFPGAGHWYLGHKDRARFFAGLLVPIFLIGLAISGFAAVSPTDRHPIWGLAQMPGGLLTLVAWLATMGVKVTSTSDLYGIGCLYTGSACLLNLIALCDVWDLGEGEEPEPESETEALADEMPSNEEPA